MSKRRVVITGLGIVSPVGIGIPGVWQNIIAGKSGITRISHFDPSPFACQVAGEVKDFDVTQYLPAKDARRMDKFIHFGLVAGIEALKDSGLEITEQNAERIGVNIGSGIGGLPMIEDTHNELSCRWSTQDIAVLYPWQHHQYDLGQSICDVRSQGSELGDGVGLYYRNTLHRRICSYHRVW